MKKKELIKNLRIAAKTEEDINPVYFNHLHAILSRFDAPKEVLNKIKVSIERLIKSNTGHKKECEDVIKQLEKEKIDDI